MTLFDFEELTRYWAEHPPLHILLGAYLRLGKQQRPPTLAGLDGSRRAAGFNLEAVLARLGPGFGTGDVHAGLAPVTLDFAELRRRMESR